MPPPSEQDASGSMSYTSDWYRQVQEESASSAAVIVPQLCRLFSPHSVIDVGCGRGHWLVEFEAEGVVDIRGVDGPFLALDDLLIDRDRFVRADLEEGFQTEERFDLALCLEVAEHLGPRAARPLVAALVELAPVVVFSAAIPHQGGEHHVNERWQSYWCRLFEEAGRRPVDLLRPLLWRDERVQWWYAQNLFLYVTDEVFESLGHPEHGPLDLVHPSNYLAHVGRGGAPTSGRQALRGLGAAITRRLPGIKRG